MTSQKQRAGAGSSSTPPNVAVALLGVMLAALLSMLDNNIMGTAIPTVVGDLGGLTYMSWVVSAYILVTAVTTPVWGKFGDIFGRKQMYLLSIVIFMVGSILSGASQEMWQLVVFRVIQGVGAGGIGVGMFSLIASLVPPRQRAKYQGLTASVMVIATVGGPVIGGFVTEHLGWRWIFYMNIPLGIVAFVWCALALKLPHARRRADIDWVGIILLAVAIASLVLGATWAGVTYAWGSWQILACGVIAAVSLVAFVAWERRVSEAVLPLEIFAHPNYRVSAVLIAVGGVAMFGLSLYLPLFQQEVQGASASNSGMLLLPMMVTMLAVSIAAGTYMSKSGKFKVLPIMGTGLVTTGLLALSTMGTHTSHLTTMVYMAIAGAGLGCLLQIVTTIAQNSVVMRHQGVASGSFTLYRSIGGSLGVAVFGSMVSRAVDHRPGAYQAGLATGIDHVFLAAAVVTAVGFVLAWFIREEPLRDDLREHGESGPAEDVEELEGAVIG